MQYDNSERRSEEGQAVPKRMALSKTWRWLLALFMLLSLTGLAAWTLIEYRNYPFIAGMKTINEEPHINLISATLRKAGGLGDPDVHEERPNPPKERKVALSAHDIVRVQRDAYEIYNVTCANNRSRKSRDSISILTSMWKVRDEISSTSRTDYDPHLRLVMTYTPLLRFVEQMSFRPEGLHIIVLLTLVADSPAIIIEFRNCHRPQHVWLVKDPIIDGAQVDLTDAKRASDLYCDDTFIRDGYTRKVHLKFNLDLDVNKEWLVVKVCYGNSRKCTFVYDKKVRLAKNFHPDEVELEVMVDNSVKDLMNEDIMDVKSWCELQPEW